MINIAQYPMLLYFITITITFTLTQATQAGQSANLSGAGCLVKVTHYSIVMVTKKSNIAYWAYSIK